MPREEGSEKTCWIELIQLTEQLNEEVTTPRKGKQKDQEHRA
jgi:hypothetical protein